MQLGNIGINAQTVQQELRAKGINDDGVLHDAAAFCTALNPVGGRRRCMYNHCCQCIAAM